MRINTSMFLLLLLVSLPACKKDKKTNDTPPADINNTFGYSLLSKIPGIWNGNVSSTTALGSYPEWIVDFRPVSNNQVSAKNELDTLNDIHMSFFIAKYNNQYRLAFRNGGSFGGLTRVSYFLADSVSETSTLSYYRFAEIVKGSGRAYTEVIFKADSLLIKSYTNKYNSLAAPTLHMSWNARLQDSTTCKAAIEHFDYPSKSLTKDFSTTLNGVPEAIFYSTTGGDPYPEAAQPYLGKATITYNYGNGLTASPNKKVLLLVTAQPLISGFTFNTGNLKFRSRYVILNASDTDFTFNYMHPGSYYVYALYDNNGDLTLNSGDWVSTANTTFTLPEKGNVAASAQINFVIP